MRRRTDRWPTSRRLAAGEHAATSQRLLNELAAARLCLLDNERRTKYDAELRKSAGCRTVSRRSRNDALRHRSARYTGTRKNRANRGTSRSHGRARCPFSERVPRSPPRTDQTTHTKSRTERGSRRSPPSPGRARVPSPRIRGRRSLRSGRLFGVMIGTCVVAVMVWTISVLPWRSPNRPVASSASGTVAKSSPSGAPSIETRAGTEEAESGPGSDPGRPGQMSWLRRRGNPIEPIDTGAVYRQSPDL